MNDVFPYTLTGDPDVLAQVSNSLATTAEDVRACERTTTSVHMGATTMSGSFATALGGRATETSEALTGFGLVLDAGSQALAEYASALKRTQESAREAGSRYRAAADAEQQHNATALYYRSLADAGLGTSFAADQAVADAYTARSLMSAAERDWADAADQKIRAATAAVEVLHALRSDFVVLDRAVAAGATVLDAAAGIGAGTRAATLTSRATDSSLTQQQRDTALTELTALLEAHGEESAFTDTLFAATSTNSVHQLLGALSTSPPGSGAGASTASTDLRDAFGRWVTAQPEAGQRRIGIELWEAGDASGSMTDWAWVSFLYRSPDLPAATYEAAAQHVESDDETLGWVQPVAPGVWHDHPAAAVLGGLARHPNSSMTFLSRGDDGQVRERIAFWSEIPGGELDFATALTAAVTESPPGPEGQDAKALLRNAAHALAEGEFIHRAGPDATRVLTGAFLNDYVSLYRSAPDSPAIFDPGEMTTIIASTSQSNESARHWLTLSRAATKMHLPESQTDPVRLFESHGLIAGALERSAIEDARRDDQAVAVATTGAGAAVSVATAGAGAGVTFTVIGATTAASTATSFIDFEGNVIDSAGVRCLSNLDSLMAGSQEIRTFDEEYEYVLRITYEEAAENGAGVDPW